MVQAFFSHLLINKSLSHNWAISGLSIKYQMAVQAQEKLLSQVENGDKNIDATVIIIDISKPQKTKDGRDVRQIRIADKTGSMILAIWDELGELLKVADICRIHNGYAQMHRGSLTLYIAKSGHIHRFDNFCMLFSESPNYSEVREMVSGGPGLLPQPPGLPPQQMKGLMVPQMNPQSSGDLPPYMSHMHPQPPQPLMHQPGSSGAAQPPVTAVMLMAAATSNNSQHQHIPVTLQQQMSQNIGLSADPRRGAQAAFNQAQQQQQHQQQQHQHQQPQVRGLALLQQRPPMFMNQPPAMTVPNTMGGPPINMNPFNPNGSTVPRRNSFGMPRRM